MNRREFFQAVGDWMCLGLLVSIPVRFSQSAIKPKEKHPKDVLCATQPMPGTKRRFSDRNLVCRSYIIRPEFIKSTVQESVKDCGCEKCEYESTCICSGTRNLVDSHKTRTFYPEMWEDKYKFRHEFVNVKG